MRQFQYQYEGEAKFRKELSKMAQWCSTRVTSAVMFTIFSETMDIGLIKKVTRMIEGEMPDAQYMGCSTNGNIINGALGTSPIGIVCTIFEYPSTKIMLKQYELTEATAQATADGVVADIDANPWIKAAELLTTIRGMSMTGFCEGLGRIREGVKVFGGGAFSADMDENVALVFSKDGGISQNGIVFAYIGGEDFSVNTTHIAGWKPLGKELHVTKAKGSILYELDGKPAYDTYFRYLHIQNDDSFFQNTLEFPFFYKHNGLDILRAPVASNPDGSLSMTSDIEEDVMTRMAYGDPWTILDSVREGGMEIQKFSPEVITVFSCAARRTFWGNDEVSKETEPFQSMAPTSGFYTSSEFLRTDGSVNQHNVTLVVAAMREGVAENKGDKGFVMREEDYSGKVSMIKRLATFIEAATEELEEANRRLSTMAVTDGLTQLYNRREIQRRIDVAVRENTSTLSLVMLDIDNFKRVNDTYGHKVGDDVLKGMSKMLKDVLSGYGDEVVAGRWGGEEFMVLLDGFSADKAKEVAERMRTDFSDIDFAEAGRQTVSLGVTELVADDVPDAICTRVDEALYEAKEAGKNRVVMR